MEAGRKLGDRFYATVRTLSLPLLKGWIRLRVEGTENVPSQGPVLVVANHSSFVDPVVLGRACPRKLHFLIKKSVYHSPMLRWFFRGMDSIPVSLEGTDASALRASLRLLGAGHAVGIFPEGSRTPDGRLAEAKIGTALLATRSGCPVVPVGIRGAYEAMPMSATIPRPGRVTVTFGPPFSLKSEGGRSGRYHLESASQRIMEEIACLLQNGSEDVEASA